MTIAPDPRRQFSVTVEFQNNHPNGRRSIRVLVMSLDQRDHICHARPASGRDLFQGLPESILDTDARLATIDDNGTLANS